MKNKNLYIFTIILLVFSFFSILYASTEVFILKNGAPSLEEWRLVEVTQISVLICVVIMYILSAIKNKGDEAWMSLCFATIFYIFILREIDIKNLDVPDYIKFIFHGKGRTITAVALIAASLIGGAMRFKHYFAKAVSLLFSKRGALLWGAFAFLQVGQWLEKVDFSYNVYFEECLELIGYCLILLCANNTLKLRPYKNGIVKTF